VVRVLSGCCQGVVRVWSGCGQGVVREVARVFSGGRRGAVVRGLPEECHVDVRKLSGGCQGVDKGLSTG